VVAVGAFHPWQMLPIEFGWMYFNKQSIFVDAGFSGYRSDFALFPNFLTLP